MLFFPENMPFTQRREFEISNFAPLFMPCLISLAIYEQEKPLNPTTVAVLCLSPSFEFKIQNLQKKIPKKILIQSGTLFKHHVI